MATKWSRHARRKYKFLPILWLADGQSMDAPDQLSPRCYDCPCTAQGRACFSSCSARIPRFAGVYSRRPQKMGECESSTGGDRVEFARARLLNRPRGTRNTALENSLHWPQLSRPRNRIKDGTA